MSDFQELYLDWARDITDAPAFYHKALSYSIVSTCLGPQVHMEYGPFTLRPNLWLLIIGPSSLSRKSWSMRMATKLTRELKPGVEMQDFSSRENFLVELGNFNHDGQGLIKIDEFAGFYHRLKQKTHYQGLMQDLATLYDGDSFHKTIGTDRDVEKRTQIQIDQPYVNIISACSYDWFTEQVSSSDIKGGFLARFMLAVSTTPNDTPWPQPLPGDNSKYEQLKNKLSFISQILGEIKWSPEALREWESFYTAFAPKTQGGFWDQSYHRLIDMTRKIAMIHTIMRSEGQGAEIGAELRIEVEDLARAVAFTKELNQSFSEIVVGGSDLGVKRQKVERFLKKHESVSRSELLRGVPSLTAWELKQIIQTLDESELIEIEKKEASNYKIKESYKWDPTP